MKVLAAAFSLAIVAFGAFGVPDHAEAGTERPIFVTLLGQESVRLRIAVGITAPCDSSENRPLFDGRIAPGTYRWETNAQDVCYQHTSGALPESDWSESRVISTTVRGGGPRRIVLE